MRGVWGGVGRRLAAASVVVGVGAVRLAVGCGLVVLVWVWLPALALGAAAEEASCPNAGVRVGYSAALSRCRAYERVSPAGSEPDFLYAFHGGETGDEQGGNGTIRTEVQAAVGGDRFAYVTGYPPAGSVSDGGYLRVTRAEKGWTSDEEMIPPQSSDYSVLCESAYIAAYSPELTGEVLADGFGQPGRGRECGTDDPPLVAREPQGIQNLFVAERESGPYRLIDEIPELPEGFTPADAWFQAASEDLGHVVFTEAARLTPEAPNVGPSPDLYEWVDGTVRLVTVLPDELTVWPDEKPVEGSLANQFSPGAEERRGAETYTHAVSADGSRVFFQAKEPEEEGENLYLRVNAEQPQSPVSGGQVNGEQCTEPKDACTLQVDAAQGGKEPDGEETKSGGGGFMWATPDGEKVFFLDERRLTANSTAVEGKPDLYEYDLSAPAVERLRDLTPNATEPADVLGVSGVSEDGGYVYFVADGVLADNENPCGQKLCGAVPEQPNLYLAHAGALTFIATLDPTHDSTDWEASKLTSRVTPDGLYLAFNSDQELTGYDNVDVASRQRDGEIFLFDAASGELACVSCSPAGVRSTAYAHLQEPTGALFGGANPSVAAGYLQRNLADDGRVFFSTAQQLAGASNGLSNVYEYDAGQLHLISTGTSEAPSYFYEASADGSDVFFITAQELPSGGPANEFMVYDAREDGGFPPAPVEEACAGEERCRGPAAPLTEFTAPPTASVVPASPSVTGGAGEVKGVKVVSSKTAAQVRRERLAHALALCRKKRSRHKRSVCEARARRTYGTKKAKKTKQAARGGAR